MFPLSSELCAFDMIVNKSNVPFQVPSGSYWLNSKFIFLSINIFYESDSGEIQNVQKATFFT